MVWLMPIMLLLMLPLGMWASIPGLDQFKQQEMDPLAQNIPRLKRGPQAFKLIRKRTANAKPETEKWTVKETHRRGIHFIHAEEEQQPHLQKDRHAKQALIQMLGKNLKDSNYAAKPQRVSIVADVDIHRDFASEEPNPYVESLGNICELA